MSDKYGIGAHELYVCMYAMLEEYTHAPERADRKASFEKFSRDE